MPAAEQEQTEQELPASICQPWHVRLSTPGAGRVKEKSFGEMRRNGRSGAAAVSRELQLQLSQAYSRRQELAILA